MAPRSGRPTRDTEASRNVCDFSGILSGELAQVYFPTFSLPPPLSLLPTRVGGRFMGNVLSQRHVLGLHLSGLPDSRYN